MAKLTKKEDYVEAILKLSMDKTVQLVIDGQEFIVASFRMEEELSDDGIVAMQNNIQLLDEMKTEQFSKQLWDIHREEYMELDLDSLKFIYQASKVTGCIEAVEKRCINRLEEVINSYEFLVPVQEEKQSKPTVLH